MRVRPFEKMRELIIERMDLVLTTKCSLRCEKCANLMQYYEKPYDVKLGVIYKSVEKLMKSIDLLNQIYVLGGEPFMYPELGEVISFLIEIDKIKEIIVVTNATISPSDTKLLGILRNKKVVIRISNYGELSKNIEQLVNVCKEYGVNYILEEKGFFYDTGNMKCRNRTDIELNKVFLDCSTQCRSLFRGELHYCPRSAHGTDLNLVPKEDGDYIDILSYEEEVPRKVIEDFMNRKNHVKACDYCDIRTPGYYDRKIPLAKQAKSVLRVDEESINEKKCADHNYRCNGEMVY